MKKKKGHDDASRPVDQALVDDFSEVLQPLGWHIERVAMFEIFQGRLGEMAQRYPHLPVAEFALAAAESIIEAVDGRVIQENARSEDAFLLESGERYLEELKKKSEEGRRGADARLRTIDARWEPLLDLAAARRALGCSRGDTLDYILQGLESVKSSGMTSPESREQLVLHVFLEAFGRIPDRGTIRRKLAFKFPGWS